MRLPVVMQQLHHLTQCACTAFARSFLLRRAGILNTIGGAYCIKAKSAIAAMQSNGGGAAATAVPVAAQAVPAQAAPNKI